MENIINKFSLVIHEYLNHMKQSVLLKTIDNSEYIVIIGLNSIIHVFKIVLQNVQSVETAYYYCQKAYYCYLEYIEQMNNTNLLHNLNNLDAIIFVYKKTMDDIHNTTTIALQSSVSNMMSINNKETNTLIMDSDLIFFSVSNLSMMAKTILFQQTEINEKGVPIDNICKIADTYLDKYLSLIHNEEKYGFGEITIYMQNIQDKIQMNHIQYMNYLKEGLKVLKKMKKDKTFPTESSIRNKYLSICSQEDTVIKLQNLIEHEKYGLFVKEVYGFLPV
jgi:hypothetical protein